MDIIGKKRTIMSSKLSPALANILCHIMELTIIERHKRNANIAFYVRRN